MTVCACGYARRGLHSQKYFRACVARLELRDCKCGVEIRLSPSKEWPTIRRIRDIASLVAENGLDSSEKSVGAVGHIFHIRRLPQSILLPQQRSAQGLGT